MLSRLFAREFSRVPPAALADIVGLDPAKAVLREAPVVPAIENLHPARGTEMMKNVISGPT